MDSVKRAQEMFGNRWMPGNQVERRERNGMKRGGKAEKEDRRERSNETLLKTLVFPFCEVSFCITNRLDLHNY